MSFLVQFTWDYSLLPPSSDGHHLPKQEHHTMHGAGVQIHEVGDVSVWKAMSGPSIHIPAVGSVVSYYPYLHAQACQVQLPPNFLPNEITARVTSLHLKTNGDDLFAEFELDPAFQQHGEGGTDMHSGGEIGEIEAGVQVCTKRFSKSDVGNGWSCYLPTAFGMTTFPALPNGGSQDMTASDLAGNAVTFKYILRFQGGHRLGGDPWHEFVAAKEPREGQTLVFIRRGIDEYAVGIRRGQHSCRPTAQEMITVAQNFNRITYYPEVSREYVILEELIFYTDLGYWYPGQAVTFTVEDNQANLINKDGFIETISKGLLLTIRSHNKTFTIPAWKVAPANTGN